MVFTQHYCAKCASEQIRRNGHRGGRAKYPCKACGHQGYFQPAAVEKARQYAQVDQLLAGRNSLRSIARATGVARNTIAKRVKKALRPAPALPRRLPERVQRRQGEDLELDEMRTFVGRKRRNVWLWLAVERASRRTVAWVLGSRGTATLRRLWAALPRRYHRHTRYFTDQWRAYRQVLPAGDHIVGKSGTRVVEALNGKLRHRCGLLVRRS